VQKKKVTSDDGAGYPTIAEVKLSRRGFLAIAGLGTAAFVALKGCFGAPPRMAPQTAQDPGPPPPPPPEDTGQPRSGADDAGTPGPPDSE